MTAQTLAWIAFAVFVGAIGARATLAEAVWPSYRVVATPRRVVRGLDVLAVLAVAVLGAALVAIVGPAVLRR